VGAEFYDAAAVEDRDAVGVANGGDAVGDEDCGASLHDFAEVVEDFVFSVSVNAGEGVVEDEDAGAADEGAGDGGALLLASGEGDAALADDGFVFLGELFDVAGDVSGFGGPTDVVIGGVLHAECNVLADGLAEEECFLGDEADVAAQVGERVFADGFAVDEDRAGGGVVDAGDEANQGGLA